VGKQQCTALTIQTYITVVRSSQPLFLPSFHIPFYFHVHFHQTIVQNKMAGKGSGPRQTKPRPFTVFHYIIAPPVSSPFRLSLVSGSSSSSKESPTLSSTYVHGQTRLLYTHDNAAQVWEVYKYTVCTQCRELGGQDRVKCVLRAIQRLVYTTLYRARIVTRDCLGLRSA